jgi:hypothetical protein
MTAEEATQPRARQNLLGATVARFIGAGRSRSHPRRGRLRNSPLLGRLATGNVIQSPDPVLLAALAIDRVGPAAVRASASGVEVRVSAPDEATARVLRAALAETARRRHTDRLVRIVVVQEAEME